MRRILGAALIALPIVTFLTSMVINRGWGYVIAMLVVVGLSSACMLGGTYLLSPKNKDR